MRENKPADACCLTNRALAARPELNVHKRNSTLLDEPRQLHALVRMNPAPHRPDRASTFTRLRLGGARGYLWADGRALTDRGHGVSSWHEECCAGNVLVVAVPTRIVSLGVLSLTNRA